MATKNELESLQDLLAVTMRAELESGEAGAATLNVVRQFLKDHNIQLKGSDEIGALAACLADVDESEMPENVHKMNR